jgi:thioredoxin type arsenate reductase
MYKIWDDDGPPPFLKLLGHELRWQLLTVLGGSDRRVQELVDLLARPQNLVSYHLRLLREAELVRERRSSQDGRDIYYSLDVGRLESLYRATGQALHPALEAASSTASSGRDGQTDRPCMRVIFLCTENSARSQMAEGILRKAGGELVDVSSAGSQPGEVHPLAIRAMAEMGVDISAQRAKHMAQFVDERFDYVITVCDRVREVCPVFPDDPERIHWSFEDPAAAQGGAEERYAAFQRTARELVTRVSYLLLMIQRGQG